MPRTKKLSDGAQLAQEVRPVAPTPQPTSEATNVVPGLIDEASTYEWGILQKESTTTGNVDNAAFSTTRIGNWHGGSLSWNGGLFRRTNRRAIKTFADFQAQNPLGLPTNKTFFFFKVTVDAEGIRKRYLVHEGTFSDMRPQVAPQSKTYAPSLKSALGDPMAMGINQMHPASADSRSVREAMERTISDLQREIEVIRRERDMLRESADRLRAENDANRERIINIEGERIKHSVEMQAAKDKYEGIIERLTTDHAREIDRLLEENARDIADTRISAEKAAIQTLNDGQSLSEKLVNGFTKLMDTVQSPQFAPIAQMVMSQIGRVAGGMNANAPAQVAPQIPPAVGGQPGANYLSNPFSQDLSQSNMPEAQYQTAEVAQNG